MERFIPDSYDVSMTITDFRKLMEFATGSAGIVKWKFTPDEIEMIVNDVGLRGRLDLFWNTSSLDYECNNPIEAMIKKSGRGSVSINELKGDYGLKEFPRGLKGLPRDTRIFFTHGGGQLSAVNSIGTVKFTLLTPKTTKFQSASSTYKIGKSVKEVREEWSDREIMNFKFRFADFIEELRGSMLVQGGGKYIRLSYENDKLLMFTKTKIIKRHIPITPKKVFKSTGIFEGWYDSKFLWEIFKSLRPRRDRNSGFFTMRVHEKGSAKSPNFLILEALDKKSNIRKEAYVTGIVALPKYLQT